MQLIDDGFRNEPVRDTTNPLEKKDNHFVNQLNQISPELTGTLNELYEIFDSADSQVYFEILFIHLNSIFENKEDHISTEQLSLVASELDILLSLLITAFKTKNRSLFSEVDYQQKLSIKKYQKLAESNPSGSILRGYYNRVWLHLSKITPVVEALENKIIFELINDQKKLH